MKIKKIIFISVALFCITRSYSQKWTIPYNEAINFELKELLVNNDSFISILDSILLNGECVKGKENDFKYFFMLFEKGKDCEYKIIIELLRLPIGNSSLYGFFKINNFFFFVNGIPPHNLFQQGTKNKKFTYKKSKIAIIEEFSIWHFRYENFTLSLEKHYCF
ncbi:MAG: hypothetical protein LBR65_05070 [Culturomica sp.]|jgi:hypothetical protein|nr:hypothetical protein [Culturomica sp.]